MCPSLIKFVFIVSPLVSGMLGHRVGMSKGKKRTNGPYLNAILCPVAFARD